MRAPDNAQPFIAILQQIKQQLQGLQQALQQEQSALREQNLDPLPQLAQQKEQYTARINQLEAQRGELLQGAGYESDPQQMETFLSRLDRNARRQGQQLWDEIMELASSCERQNKVNGVVVSHQQRRAQTLIAMLRNEAGGSDVYAADGNKEGHQNGHSLARA